MNRQWARRGVVGALLLGMVAFMVLFFRLDEQVLYRQVIAELEAESGLPVQGDKIRLSLQHGLSLKVSHLRIGGPVSADTAAASEWGLQADVVRFDIDLTSLLFGDMDIASVDLVHPVLSLPQEAAGRLSLSDLLSTSFVERVMLGTPLFSFREGVLKLGERVVADQITTTVRRIDREQQTTWELQSRYAGGDLASQGYIRTHSDASEKVFGRISATQLKMDRLAELSLPKLHYDLLDASLTFSLDDAGQWQWFGNLLTHDAHDHLPELSWRGKLDGSGLDDFRLHDAFVRFGENTRLVLEGGCKPDAPCTLAIDTKGANPGMLLRALDIEVPLSGKLDAGIRMQQSAGGEGWDMAGSLGLRSAKWGKLDLSDSSLEFTGMQADSPSHYSIARADIHPQGDAGTIRIEGMRRDGDAFRMQLSSERLDGAWVPLGNVLLAAYDLKTADGDQVLQLSGEGAMSGSMQLETGADAWQLDVDVDASQAAIRLGELFVKPAGVAAGMHGRYQQAKQARSLQIGALTLGGSHLERLALSESGDARRAGFSGAELDADALEKAGVRLPAELAGWTGQLQGSLDAISLDAGLAPRQRLAQANGSLSLKTFGRDGQRISGDVRLHRGRLTGKKLNWQRASDFADFDADVVLGTLKGRVDVYRAGLAWSPDMQLAGWADAAELTGRFAQTDVLWDGNTWKDLHGTYRVRRGGLELEHVRGSLGEGLVQSRRMRLESLPGGVHLEGLFGMSAVRLNDLQGLVDVTGAQLDGYAFVNARLQGSLPLGSGAWSGDGDIEIHRGLWREARPAHRIEWMNPAAVKLAAMEQAEATGRRFERLNVRFRLKDDGLHLRRLHFVQGGMQAVGEVDVAPDGQLAGELKVSSGESVADTGLSGRWPTLSGLFAPQTP